MRPSTIIGVAALGLAAWLLLARRVSASELTDGGVGLTAPGSTPEGQPGPSKLQKILGLSVGTATTLAGSGLLSGGTAAAAGGATAAGATGGASGGGSALGTTGAFLATNPVGWAILGGVGGVMVWQAIDETHNDHRDYLNETLDPLGQTLAAAPGYETWAANNQLGLFWLMHVLVGIEGSGANDKYYGTIAHVKTDDDLRRNVQTIDRVLAGAATGQIAVIDPRSRDWAATTLAALAQSDHDWVREQLQAATGSLASKAA